MKTKCFLAGLLTCTTTPLVHAQVAEQAPSPKGQAIVQVFTNFHTSFGAQNGERGFELERSYLGYQYHLGKGLSVKAVFDIGKSSAVNDYHRIAYVKHAEIAWKKDKWTLNGGLISTKLFNFQEKHWGYRYVAKSFQDEYKYGSSADLGLSATYDATPWLSLDAIVVNGEGYKKIQSHDGLNYGLGLTLTPLKGWSFRLYGGLNESGVKEKKDVVNVATMVGYKDKRLSFGVEYNYMSNNAHIEGADRSGLSVYASTQLAKNVHLFARYDDNFSKADWNKAQDEAQALLGAEFKLGKYVKLAPNFRLSLPKDEGAKTGYMAYVNCYFGL